MNGAVSYSEGDYGSGDNTRIVYVPATVTRLYTAGYGSATVSCVGVDSEGEGSDSGIGDTLLQGGLYAMDEDDDRPGIDLIGKLKIPTADDDEGLGTGAVDVGGGAELYKWLRYPWIGFLDAYLMIIGDSSETDRSTQQIADVGLGHQTSRSWFNSLFLEYRSAIVSDEDDSVSAYYVGSYRMTRDVNIHGTLEAGLTDGAPDYSVSLGLSLYIFE